MKQKLKLLLAVALLCSNAFAQKNWLGDKKGSLVGISFNLADFKGPSGIKDPVTGKVYGTVPQMDKGLPDVPVTPSEYGSTSAAH